MRIIILLFAALNLCLTTNIVVRADMRASDPTVPFEQTRQKFDNLNVCSLPSVMEINDAHSLYNLLPESERLAIEGVEENSGASYSLRLINEIILQDWDLYKDKMNPKLNQKTSVNQQMKNLVENYQMIRFGKSPCAGNVQVDADVLEGFDSVHFARKPVIHKGGSINVDSQKNKILVLVEPLEGIRKKLDSWQRCELPSIQDINKAYDIFRNMDNELQLLVEEAHWFDADLYPLKLIKQNVLQNWESQRDKMNPNLKLKATTTRQMMMVVENYQLARFGQSSCTGAIQVSSKGAQTPDDIFAGLSQDYYKSGPSSLSSAIELAARADNELGHAKATLDNIQAKLDDRNYCKLPTVVELNHAKEVLKQLKPEQRSKIEHANWLDVNLYPLKLIMDMILQDWESNRNKMNPKLKVKGAINRHMQNLVEKYQLARFGLSPCAGVVLVRGDALDGADQSLFNQASDSLGSALKIAAN